MTDPDMGGWQYGYDNAGNLTAQRDGAGRWLHLEYDALNRLVRKRQDSTSGLLLAEWQYDAAGQVGLLSKSLAYSGAGTTEVYNVAYDALNRPMQQQWTVPGAGGGVFRFDRSYNTAGQTLTLRYPGGNAGQPGELVTYGYNAIGQLSSVTSEDGTPYISATSYNGQGQVTEQRLDAGAQGFTRQYAYNPTTLRLETLKAGKATPFEELQKLSYTYDLAGNVQTLTDATNSNQTQTFGYDWLDRLTSAATTSAGVGQYSHTYTYNAIGNLTSYNGNAYTYGSQPHAVTGAFGNSYGYDAVGNQTSRIIAGTTYTQTFDYDNRLVAVAGGSVSAGFLYDADGNRVKGTVAGVTTVYIAGLYEWQNGAVTKYYEGGALRRTGYAADNGVFYALSDQVRSTSALVNQDGTVNGRNYYYPYGGNRGESAFSGITTKRFTGQYHEQGLPGGEGLSYYNARWYDAQIAVFISADTIVPSPMAPQTLNRYAYTGGNPLTYVDPSGHYACEDDCGRIQFTPKGYTYYNPRVYSAPIYRLINQTARGRQEAASLRMRRVLKQSEGLGQVSWSRTDRTAGRAAGAHFRGVGGLRGDDGFKREFRDDHWYQQYWGGQRPESRQTGHFLSAVDYGMRTGTVAKEFSIHIVVGHEKVSDSEGPLRQLCYYRGCQPNPDDIGLFKWALDSDARGEYGLRDLALTWILEPQANGGLANRKGNSLEDLRLSVRGYRLGEMLITGDAQLQTNSDLADWIARNVTGQ